MSEERRCPAGWVPVTLTCLDPVKARSCVRYLAGMVPASQPRNVGAVVEAFLYPPDTIKLAEDAVARGWASDPDAGQAIAAMSDTVDEYRRDGKL